MREKADNTLVRAVPSFYRIAVLTISLALGFQAHARLPKRIFLFTTTENASHSTTVTQTYVLPAAVNYTHDLNGNLTSDGALGYEYDDADRLVRITATNQWKSEFIYDALSRRNVRREYTWNSGLGTWNSPSETRYVWLGMSLVQERDAANKVRVTYTGKLAREDAQGTAFYFTDGNGNVSSLIDSSGNITAKYRYDSFGNLVSKSGSLADANLIRFSGKEYHAQSGLYYYGYRYYAPNLQRWMNEDPIGIAGGLNLYGFVGNDPIDLMDPNGLEGWPWEEATWMSKNGNPHYGTPPSEQPKRDPDSYGAQHGFGEITDGQLLGDSFRDDFIKPVVKKSIENGFNAATCIPLGGEEAALAAGEKALAGGEKAAANLAKEEEALANAEKELAEAAKCPVAKKGIPGKDLPGKGDDWTKLKGDQGWKDADGNFWKKDMKHKDHWDVSDRRGNKIREVDYNGNQLWPGGPKNKNK